MCKSEVIALNAVSKKIGIFFLTVTLLGICILGGLLKSNRFGKSVPADASETETEIVMQALPEGKKANIPQVIRGTKSFLATDPLSGDAMQQIAETGFNCVVFLPSRTDSAFAPQADTALLSEAVSAARGKGLYTAVRVNVPESTDTLSAFAAQTGADSLILCGSLYSADELRALQESLTPTCVSSVLADTPFADSDSALSALLDQGLLDGIYTEPDTSAKSDSFDSTLQSLKDCSSGRLLWVSQSEKFVSDKSGFDRLSEVMRQISAIFRSDEDAPVSTVFCAFSDFSADDECRRIVRTCMTEHILPDNFLKDFKITSPKSTSVTTDESKITFNGECNPLYPLTCNQKAVAVTQDGFFAAEYTLQVGKNTFTFTHRGKSYTYNVTYQMDLIKSISPSGSLSTPGGNVLEISVVAHRSASKVYATLNGTTIPLTGSNALLGDENNDSLDTSSDFVTYSGKYNLPESTSKNFSLGAIKAFASYHGISDSITGAVVTITAAQKIEALPVVEESKKPESTTSTTTTTTTIASTTDETDDSETDLSETQPSSSPISAATTTTAQPSVTTSASAAQKPDPVITPYNYNGVAGRKRMCVVTKYYAETMPLSPLNDLSVPLTTPLLTGTFDFITGESSFDSYKYYNLGSGRRVYRKDVEVIENAYAMPANTITLVSSGTASDKTNICLHLKWKVPFNAVLNGQGYINDPQNGREYAVTKLSAKSLDLTFYYTAEATGLPNVASSGVISSSEWVRSASAQTCTLRLYLRNAAKFYGYSVSYNADDTLQISIKERTSLSLSGKTVMLDPGHGGTDGGAPCAVNGTVYNEAKINLSIAKKVKEKLSAKGASVLMTRTADSGNPTLEDRKKMARQNNPDVFVSIHCDSAASSSAYGTSAFYYRPYSYGLASSIHTQLVGTYINQIYGTNKSTIDRKTIFFPYSVCRIEECPSVLIECGYVSSLEECRILQTAKHQDSLAAAIAAGIEKYFSN